MDFTLSQEQTLFRDSVARFLADEYDFEARRRIVAEAPGFLESHWRQFAELGWLAAPIPEAYGGLGGSAFETMVLMEQLGRGLVVSPYFASVILGGQLVLHGGGEAHKASILPAVADGTCRLAVAVSEPGARFDLAHVATRAEPDGDAWRLDGTKAAVLFAEAADRIIVPARTAGAATDRDGIALFLVEADAAGLEAYSYSTIDGGRASDLRLAGVPVGPEALLAGPEAGLPALEAMAEHALAALAAEASGILWAVYERTLDYLKTRRQFGQPLGAFQALQHRMVDIYMKCQLMQSLTLDAAAALQDGHGPRRRRAVAAAKAEIGRGGRAVGQDGIQLHGGMGMTDELPIGHAYKRLVAIDATLGDADHHLARYAGLLHGEAAAAR
jgi:alkylation response protein AidB-like acyl-CoA dehydrogenase